MCIGRPDRLTRFLRKITNQAIKNSKVELLRGGGLLDQDANKLLERFAASSALLSELNHLINLMNPCMLQGRGHSRSSRARIGPEALDSGVCIFGFTERLNRVSGLLRTVKQFSALFQARIDGLESIVAKLQSAVQAVRALPYDILDHTKAAFDADHTIFDTEISFIELSLKRFIDASFNELHSTDLALRLFGELEAVLDREALKNELQDKYAAIFQYYGEELESVQDVYDREKFNPPVPRNVSPVTGKVLWSRHLLTRVEGPMIRFQSCKNLLGSKEDSRRIIRVYNKIAKTLIQYETMWVGAWCLSIDSCRDGLHATLLVRHPDNADYLCVNFDREIIALIREVKALQRLGIDIPESAQSILAQESKFKLYFERLSLFVQEYNALICRPTPTIKALMAAHFEELERIVRPGMVALTWQSMNIDSYLHRCGHFCVILQMVTF
jgi:dynein heavy chain